MIADGFGPDDQDQARDASPPSEPDLADATDAGSDRRRGAGHGRWDCPLNPSSTAQDRARDLIGAAVIILLAFAIRAPLFGDPLIHVDENFYLLVGDRMLHGALPFVDIWDRKPIGLFLIYAAIRLLGGDGIIQYQVVATLFAAGTGLIIARMAQPMAGRFAATAAAVIYLLLLGLVGGAGGQAPVFYNLFVAGAAWAAASVWTDPAPSPARVRWRGALAMALIGLGLQVKYTVVFEGVFLGLTLLWASWKASRDPGRLALDAMLWVALALAPTGLALAWYVAIGHGEAFVYANFLSIGARGGADGHELLHRLGKALNVLLAPLLVVLLAAILAPWRAFPRGGSHFRFALVWLGAAVAGYLAFGTYFDHYALPLFAPLALAAAPFFAYRRRLIGPITAVALILAGGGATAVIYRDMGAKRGGPAQMAAMVAAIKPRLTNCLYVWNGDPLLYHLTGSCLPTRYPFAGHLNLLREQGAVGVDQATEVRRVLAGKPRVIVDRQPTAKDVNMAVAAIVEAELRRDYQPVAVIPLRERRMIVYERKPDRQSPASLDAPR